MLYRCFVAAAPLSYAFQSQLVSAATRLASPTHPPLCVRTTQRRLDVIVRPCTQRRLDGGATDGYDPAVSGEHRHCVTTAFVAKTLPLPLVCSTAFAAKTAPFPQLHRYDTATPIATQMATLRALQVTHIPPQASRRPSSLRSPLSAVCQTRCLVSAPPALPLSLSPVISSPSAALITRQAPHMCQPTNQRTVL